MYTQRSNISSCLTTNPEHSQPSFIIEFKKFTLMHRTNTQLTFDGGDKRGTLKQSTREIFNSSRKGIVICETVM